MRVKAANQQSEDANVIDFGTGWSFTESDRHVSLTLTNATVSGVAPGLNGLTIKDGSARTMLEVENISLDSAHYTPALILSGSNGGVNGAGGRTWVVAIDATAATPYRDYAIAAKYGGADGLTPGAVYDFVYANHRGTSPPTLSIGNSSAFTPAAQVGIIMAADGAGNVTDNTLSNLVLHTGLLTGGSPQTQPAVRVTTWQSGTDRMHIEADGSVALFDGGGGATVLIGAASNAASFKTTSFNLGVTAYGSTAHSFFIHNGAANADAQIATTSGGAIQIQALNATGTVNLWTTNNSDLIIGTNGVVRLTVAKTTGALTQAYSQTLAAGVGDITLATQTPVIAGAFTATRLNYILASNPTGAATITDAAVFQFDAAAGTHKATVGATTKTTPTAVTAWMKVNMNGTILFAPLYASTTA